MSDIQRLRCIRIPHEPVMISHHVHVGEDLMSGRASCPPGPQRCVIPVNPDTPRSGSSTGFRTVGTGRVIGEGWMIRASGEGSPRNESRADGWVQALDPSLSPSGTRHRHGRCGLPRPGHGAAGPRVAQEPAPERPRGGSPMPMNE